MNKKRRKILSYLASLSCLTGVTGNLPNNVTFAVAEKTENEIKAETVVELFEKWMRKRSEELHEEFQLANPLGTTSYDFRQWLKPKVMDDETFKESYINNFEFGDKDKYKNDFFRIMSDFVKGIPRYTGFVGAMASLDGPKLCYLDDMIVDFKTDKLRAERWHVAVNYINQTFNPPNNTLELAKVAGKGAVAAGCAAAVGMALNGLIGAWSRSRTLTAALQHKAKFQMVEDARAIAYAKSICRDPNKINVDVLCKRLMEIGKSYPYAKKEFTVFANALVGAILEKQNDPRAKCPPIIIIGAPGCGKSRLVKEVVNAIRLSYEGDNWKSDDKPKKRSIWSMIFGKKEEIKVDVMKTGWERDCVYICQDKIDKKSSVSPKDQLFGKHEEQKQDVKITVYSEDYMANNFGGDNIYFKFVDEFDKLDPAVLENCWDSADGGGKAIILGAANGLPTDYVDIKGASGKKAFLSRTVSIFLPSPDFSYYGKYIKKGIDLLNKRGTAQINLSPEVEKYLSEQCVKEDAGMRSVIKMLTTVRGLQGQCDIKGINTVTLRGGEHPQDITCDELSPSVPQQNDDLSPRTPQQNVEKLLDALEKRGISIDELNKRLLSEGFTMNDINNLAAQFNRENINVDELDIDNIVAELRNHQRANNLGNDLREEGLVE